MPPESRSRKAEFTSAVVMGLIAIDLGSNDGRLVLDQPKVIATILVSLATILVSKIMIDIFC